MGGSCAEGQYWDALVGCMDCQGTCQNPHVISRCRNFCEAVNCKTLPGHYYDKLLNKCIACEGICGTHPPECAQHCRITTGPSILEDSDIVIYSLLAVCMALLFSSLFLAFVAFLRGSKAKTSNAGPTQGNKSKKKKKSEARPGQESGFPGRQQGKSSKDFLTSPSCPVNVEPSDDSIPTETCVCVHCFPDMNARGQATMSLRDPYSFYQQAVLQRAQIQNGGPHWTEQSFQTHGIKAQEEAAVG